MKAPLIMLTSNLTEPLAQAVIEINATVMHYNLDKITDGVVLGCDPDMLILDRILRGRPQKNSAD